MNTIIRRLTNSVTNISIDSKYRDPKLFLGISFIILLVLFGFIGRFFINEHAALIGANLINQGPSAANWLGTDTSGRDLFTIMVIGTPNTLKIGLLAGGIGTLIGVFLGLISGYFGGIIDTFIRSAADILLTIPLLALLIVIAATIRVMSVEMMALIVAAVSWAGPTRTIRSQTLTLRERTFTNLALLSGVKHFEIVFKEILPNLSSYIAASLVGAITGSVLAAVGLQIIGLGPQTIPTLGMTLHWALQNGALIKGMWWWWGPPVAILIILFIGLFLISIGLDKIANPRIKGGN